jgi:hypothetical protein
VDVDQERVGAHDLAERTGTPPLVLDSTDIRADPSGLLSQLCAALGIPGLTFMTRYLKGDNFVRTRTLEGTEWERNTDIGYVFQSGALKNLEVKWRNGTYRSNGSGSDLMALRLHTEGMRHTDMVMPERRDEGHKPLCGTCVRRRLSPAVAPRHEADQGINSINNLQGRICSYLAEWPAAICNHGGSSMAGAPAGWRRFFDYHVFKGHCRVPTERLL